MQKPGDVCENCKERWERKKVEPKVLVKAPNSTQNKKLVVAICPWCDGGDEHGNGGILGIMALGNHDDLEPA